MANDVTATSSPIDELGGRAFRIARQLSEVSKFLLGLGLVLAAASVIAGVMNNEGDGAIAGVVGGLGIGFVSFVQYLLLTGFAVLIEMKAFELFFLEDDDEDE